VPLLVLLYIWLLRRKKKMAVRYASLSIIKEAMGTGQSIRRHIPPALFLLAMAAMLLAASRPMAVVVLPSNQQTIILAMDVSGSMRATDVLPNRLVAAQDRGQELPQGPAAHVKVGIVAFAAQRAGGAAAHHQPRRPGHRHRRFQLQRATATGNAIVISLATIFPTRASTGALQRAQTASAASAIDDEEGEEGVHAGGAGLLHLGRRDHAHDGQRTTGVDPLDAAKMPPPTAACASTRWAWARWTARPSASRAGRCACGSTKRR
jgi:Ca-activated chloride channel family protein